MSQDEQHEQAPFYEDQRLRKVERLRKRAEFLRARRTGKRRTSDRFVVFASPNGLKWSRLGVTVSKKVGHAPRRSRWKRLLREAFRTNKRDFAPGYDFIIIVKPKLVPTKRDDVHAEIAPLAKKAVELLEKKKNNRRR